MNQTINYPEFDPASFAPDILTGSQLPILLCNLRGEVLFNNDAYGNYFGVSREMNIRNRFVGDDIWDTISESLQDHAEWIGYSILFRGETDEVVLKVRVSKFGRKYRNEEVLACFFTETNEARQRIFRQGQLLKASSVASTLLVVSQDFRQTLGQVVESMGKAVQTDRCYIFESIWLPDSDQVYASLLAQWSREDGLTAEPEVQMISYTLFPTFYETLHSGKPYSRQEEDFHGYARKFLEQRGIRSLICLPIFKDKMLWGFMGFDDCQQARLWEEQEIASLTLLTNSLSSILSNNQLREELEKKNTQLESAILGSRDSLWDYDISKERIYYSPQFLDLLGYRKGELKGSIEDLSRFVHPEHLPGVHAALNRILSEQINTIESELRLIHKSGNIIWIRLRALVNRDVSGYALRISGSNTDITLEKEYESRIAESQEKYKELVDNLRETVFQLNSEGKIRFLNDAWSELSATPVEESLNRLLTDFIVEEDRDKFQGMCQHLLKNPNAYLNCLIRFGAEEVDIVRTEVYARSIFRDGSEPYILGTIIDVSQRYIAEQKLKESEMRYRLISDNISDLVTLQDHKGTFIYVSPSVGAVLGMQVGELLGKKPDDIWKKKEMPAKLWSEEGINLFSGNRNTYRFTKPGGNKVWLETMRSVIDTGEDDSFLIQSTTRDITAFKEAEINLKTSLEQQKELNELRSDFISMASHEFRTPLTTIRSSVQLLEEYGKSAPDAQQEKMARHYTKIKEQIERVTRLMNNVLTVGRFEAGKTPFQLSEGNLYTFIEELIADHFSNQPDRRTVNLSYSGNPTPVQFDPNLMAHVFINLTSNALKYSEGCPNPEILVEYLEETVRVVVQDYGIGIPPEDYEKVFQTFYRSRNSIGVPGTGLGLVITKEFVHLHNGTITIESELTKQTRVIVEIPILNKN